MPPHRWHGRGLADWIGVDMGEGSETLVLRWAWRHYSLDMDEYDSLDEALQMSKALSDDGVEALDCIEVWDATGYRIIPGGDALDMARDRFPDEPYEPRQYAAIVEITAPGGREGLGRSGKQACEWFEDREKAEARAAHLRSVLGDDRVRIVEPRVINGVATRPL